jgi:hypothetical protein
MSQIDDLIEEFKHDMECYVCNIKSNKKNLKRPYWGHESDPKKIEKSILFKTKQVDMCKLSIKVLTSIRDKGTYPMQEYYDFMDDYEDYLDFPSGSNLQKWFYENKEKILNIIKKN